MGAAIAGPRSGRFQTPDEFGPGGTSGRGSDCGGGGFLEEKSAGNLGKNMGSGGTFYWFDVHFFQQNPNFVGLFDIFFVFFHPR